MSSVWHSKLLMEMFGDKWSKNWPMFPWLSNGIIVFGIYINVVQLNLYK